MDVSKQKIISYSGLKLIFIVGVCILVSCKDEFKATKTIDDKGLPSKTVIETITKQSQNSILVCAHRGFHKKAPENSLKSIQDAIDANIDIVELDVRTTKDSVLILMHDDKIDRTTSGKGYVKDYTFEQLLKFNLRIKDSMTPHKIPKVNDVLLLAKDKVILNLDIKDLDLSSLYQLLKDHKMEHQVFSFIWNKETIKDMVKIDSLYAVLPLSTNKAEMDFNLQSYASSLQHFTDESYTSDYMDWARKNGVTVFINSLWDIDVDFSNGNIQSMDSLLALKPAIVQTDHPKLLVDYLKEKGLHK